MKIPASIVSKPEAVRVASIFERLERSGKNAPGAEVFEAFEELDALPADVVRAVLASVTGPAPDPEQLDAATRKAHGFPPPRLVLRCSAAISPQRIEELDAIGQAQLARAGTAWDGQELPASARLAKNGGESSFVGAVERKTFVDADGTPMFDAILHGEGSGAVFKAGTSEVVGAVAYGVVEMTDKRARVGLQAVLENSPEVVERAVAAADESAFHAEPATQTRVKKVAAAKTATKKSAAAKPATKKTATKKVAADTAAKSTATKQVAAKPATEKVAAKKTPTTKVAAKAATKKIAAKKTAAKPATKKTAAKTATKKTATKKTAAKTATKKTATKKTAAKTTAKTATKKTAAKAATKKTAAKKTAAKKTAAKKTPTKKTAAKTATKKTAAAKT